MDDALNPYAPPRTEVESPITENCYRRGRLLVIREGAEFPWRCSICNAPTMREGLRRTVFWHHPRWALLLFCFVIPYVIAYFFVTRRVTFALRLCEWHARRRALGFGIGLPAWVVGILMLYAGSFGSGLKSLGLGLMAFAVVFMAICTQVPHLIRVEGEWIVMRGCGRRFLESLPSR